jgi:hypothetical protein
MLTNADPLDDPDVPNPRYVAYERSWAIHHRMEAILPGTNDFSFVCWNNTLCDPS